MILMDKFPFSSVHGIEISSEIVNIANKNFDKLGVKCKSFTADAIEYSRYSDYDYFYLYNPFPKDVMEIVISKIVESFGNKSREVTIIYNNPTCHDTFEQNNHFIKVLEFENEWGQGIFVYKSKSQ